MAATNATLASPTIRARCSGYATRRSIGAIGLLGGKVIRLRWRCAARGKPRRQRPRSSGIKQASHRRLADRPPRSVGYRPHRRTRSERDREYERPVRKRAPGGGGGVEAGGGAGVDVLPRVEPREYCGPRGSKRSPCVVSAGARAGSASRASGQHIVEGRGQANEALDPHVGDTLHGIDVRTPGSPRRSTGRSWCSVCAAPCAPASSSSPGA